MIAVGVIDIGSPKSGKLGWAVLAPDGPATTGGDLDEFIAEMARLGAQGPLAIGFEAPLFVPLRDKARATLLARSGEGSRSWSAGAGATVTTIALGIVAYTLAKLRVLMPEAVAATDWLQFPERPGQMLFFEAFVSGAAKGVDHAHDALIAAEAARELLRSGLVCRSAIEESQVFSLLGAALLRTGWSTDLRLLSTPCMVVRPGFAHLSDGPMLAVDPVTSLR
jgi:hypothetical protein